MPPCGRWRPEATIAYVETRGEALRAAGWIVGVSAGLSGLLGPVLARAWDPTSFVGIVSGSGACVLGAVIVDRRPANRAAWGFLAGGILIVAFGLCYSWAAGQVRAGNLSSQVGTVAAIAEIVGTLAGASLPLFQFLFPDGRLPSRRWRPVFALYLAGWLGGAVAVAVALWPHRVAAIVADNGPVDISIPAELDGPLRVIAATEAFAAVAMLAGVVAVVVRLRGARGNERAQLRLSLWGLWLTASLIAATAALSQAGFAGAENVTSLVAPIPFLVAVTVAMRRHRLFDVERLVGQTITYAVITALLVGLYAAVAIGAGALAALLGIGSSWAVAAATLAVAAAFRPLLRAVHALVDRHFDRRTWLAVRTIDRFTHDLRAGSAAPADLLAALRRAVDDPTATIAYLDGDGAIELDGTAARPGPPRLRREVSAGGVPVALVDLDQRLADEPRLVEAALTAAALPLENAALHARAAVRLAEVTASRNRIVQADDSNRRRIERDLHDGAQQRLVALALRLRIAERDLAPANRRAAAVLGEAVAELRAAVDELRELTRSILPPVLADEGLAVALRTVSARLPIPVTLDVTEQRLPDVVEATAWFFACEALTNAVKHAAATRLSVTIARRDDSVGVEVRDDGNGGAVLAPGGGLQGLADRVAAVNGTMRLDSRPGHGTTLRAELPCAS